MGGDELFDPVPSLEKSEIPGQGPESGKSQSRRYYLYDNELSRPKSSGIHYEDFPKFVPRGSGFRPRGRLPFNRHDYVGVYPSAKELEEERFRQLYGTSIRIRVPTGPTGVGPSSSGPNPIYNRPPDEYHGHGHRDHDPRRYDPYNDRSRRHEHIGHDRHRDHYDHYHERDHKNTDYYSRSRNPDPHSSSSRHTHNHVSPKYRSYWDSDIGVDKERLRSRTRSRSRSNDKYKQNEKDKQNENESILVPERDEFDLSIELHPLMHYIDDKEQLLDEAFGVLQGKRLKAMIPPALKDLSPKELQILCREELHDISIATIANVIDGKIIPSTEIKKRKSEGQDESEVKKKKKKKGDLVKKVKKQIKVDIAKVKSPIKKKKKSKAHTVAVKKSKVKGEGKKKRKKKKGEKEAEESGGMAPQKTLMELLELEFRAKAIKAMLKTQGHDANLVDNALAMSDPETNANDNDTPESTGPAATITKADISQVPGTIIPNDLKLQSPEPSSSNNIAVAVSPDSSTKIIPTSSSNANLESPVVVSSTALNDELNSSPESLTQESDSRADIEKEDENKSFAIDDEELDYEDELEIHPNFVPDLDEPVEVEEGEIQSGAEESESDNSSLASHRSRSLSKSPVRQSHKNDKSEEDDNERGGWRRSVSDSESDSGRPKRSRYKRKSPSELDEDKLSEVSNDDLADKIGQAENPEINEHEEQNESDNDADSLYERVEPASPQEVESDSSVEFEDTVPTDDGIIIGPMPDSNEEITSSAPEHTCADKPPDYVEEEIEKVEEEEIDATSGNENDEQDDDENLPRTWFNRWYNSKRVQKNVKSNKMIGRLRTKLRREKLIPDPPKPDPEEDGDDSVPIIGSIQEYEKLFSNPKYQYTLEEGGTNDSNSQPVEVENELDDNSDEEDEDDELWKDIIGNTADS